MGGRPLLCMNILACPAKSMDPSVFRRVLEGGLTVIREAGALLVGGHSVEDAELKYGLSVTGLIHPQRVLRNGGARPGDVLVLTKPLGTGILSTAIKGGLTGAATERQLVALLTTLNRLPMEIIDSDEALQSGAHGCTDISGFGLFGHAHEMAAASGASMRLDRQALPILPEALGFAGMGIIPEGTYRNRNHYRQWVRSGLPEMDALEMLGYDPQTSGGLLLAMARDAAMRLQDKLHQRGYLPECRVIGEVLPGEPGLIYLA
jgi:selenide,water dikinase